MINRNKQWWLSIETYVHISLKKGAALLLYNSLSGEALEYPGDGKVSALVKRLKSPKNLRVISLTGKELKDPVVKQFVEDLRKHFMGDLIDKSYSEAKPIQMIPITKVHRDVNLLKSQKTRSVGEGLLENLNQMSLYINNECGQNCPVCPQAYRQFHCCTIKMNGKSELDIAKIENMFGEISSQPPASLNILGGNIFTYPEFIKLTTMVNSFPQVFYYCNYFNMHRAPAYLNHINPASSSLKILVPLPIDEDALKKTLEIVGNSNLDSTFVFIVQSVGEFEQASAAIDSLGLDNCDFQPFFNGKNLDFFREGVFASKEEILGAKPGMNDIYANSLINGLNFGGLTVLSNGHVYANVNASRLGILGKDSIYDILYKEMYHGKSWRRIRKNLEPCKRCTFEALCPPVSNYTYAIGRNNLCHMEFSNEPE